MRGARPLLALALLTGCGGGSEPPLPPVRADLATLAPLARLRAETREIDLGEPAAREHLLAGWGPDESTGTASFVWGGGSSSLVAFEVVEPRPLTLALRGWSYPFEDGQGQQVTLRLGGVEIARRHFNVDPETWRVELPAERLVAGENRLELAYARHQEGSPDVPRAAAWDGLRFDDRPVPSTPRFDLAVGSVEIPAGSAVDWALELPADAWLAWRAIERRGPVRLELAVRAEFGEGGERREPLADPGAGRASLTGEVPGLVGVALRVLGVSGSVRLDGVALHAPSAAPLAPPPPPPRGAPPAPSAVAARPNLVVYLIDTLRADRLGCYGYARPTSPAIDAFAQAGVLFEEGRAQSPWTKPSVATVLTGLYPVTHGAQQRSQRLPESVETVAERLAAAGYQTALFTTNANVTEKFGFDQGWDHFQYLSRARGRRFQHVSSAEINQAVFAWLERRDPERPFFLFVHTLDPHDPYLPAEPFRRRLAPDVDVAAACCGRSTQLTGLAPDAARERARQAGALYDAEIAENDAAFGALLDELERRGLGASTAVLLTSDHGEEFYDHGGWKHGWTLYEEQLRVPFVLRLPGGAHAGRRIAAPPAEQIDVAPTLYQLAGVEIPGELPGASLLARLDGAFASPRTSFAWLDRPGLALASAARSGWKRIRFTGAWAPPLGRTPAELYDLVADPHEREDLEARRPLRGRWLDADLRLAAGRFGARGEAVEAEIDPELEKSLRALGYF